MRFARQVQEVDQKLSVVLDGTRIDPPERLAVGTFDADRAGCPGLREETFDNVSIGARGKWIGVAD